MTNDQLAGLTRRDLARAAGVAVNSVSRALADLTAAGLVELTYGPVPGAGSGCRWKHIRLP